MRLYELFEREDAPLAFTPRVGAKHVTIKPTPEEQQLFDRAGVTNAVQDTYVVHAYVEPIAANQEIQDRLKLRAGYSDAESVQGMINAAIDAILKTNASGMDRKWEQTRLAVEMFQNWVRSARSKFVIVPMPSSSPVVKMVAQALSDRTNAPIVDVLEKNPYPPVSHKLLTDRDRKPYDYAAAKAELDRLEQAIEQAVERNDEQGFEQATIAYEKLKAELKPYSRKTHMRDSGSLYGAAYYKTIRARDQVDTSRLRDAYVMFVDDNIVSGHTIADAVKDLLANGIRPKGILGFAPHMFK